MYPSRSFVVGKFMHKILCQMIDRDKDRPALRVILKCIQLIKEDKVSIGVFPEGYTSKDNKSEPTKRLITISERLMTSNPVYRVSIP